MPEYLSPGVYVEEYEIGPRPIEGVGTSTAGFIGMTERGQLKPGQVFREARKTSCRGSRCAPPWGASHTGSLYIINSVGDGKALFQ